MKVLKIKLTLIFVCVLLICAVDCSASTAVEGFVMPAGIPVFAVLSPEKDVRAAGSDHFSMSARTETAPVAPGTSARQDSDVLPDIELEVPLSPISIFSLDLVERCL